MVSILGYSIVPQVEVPSVECDRSRNISRMPIPKQDEKLIMCEPQRRRINPIFASLNKSASNETNVCGLLHHDLQSQFDDLDGEKQKQMNDALILCNGLIVEYNSLVTVLLGCNTNVGL